MTFLFLSVRKSETKLFSMRWAWLGALIAMLSILDFAFAILRFQNWRTFGKFEFLLSAINRFLLFPAWLLWLARQLSKAEAFQEEEGKANDELELTENTGDESPTNEQTVLHLRVDGCDSRYYILLHTGSYVLHSAPA